MHACSSYPFLILSPSLRCTCRLVIVLLYPLLDMHATSSSSPFLIILSSSLRCICRLVFVLLYPLLNTPPTPHPFSSSSSPFLIILYLYPSLRYTYRSIAIILVRIIILFSIHHRLHRQSRTTSKIVAIVGKEMA